MNFQSKPYLTVGAFVLILSTLILLTNCRKSDSDSEIKKRPTVSKSQYIQQAKMEEQKRLLSRANARYSGRFWIDYESTQELTWTYGVDSTRPVFETDIYEDSTRTNLIGSLAGFLLADSTYLNMVSIADDYVPNLGNKVHVSDLAGDEIGEYIFRDSVVISSDTISTTPTDTLTYNKRTIFACADDCYMDAVAACATSKKCLILLLLSDGLGHIGGVPRAGSVSISLACLYHCLKNSDFDLNPKTN